MAATAAPYGLRHVKMLGGRYNTNSLREIKMTTNSATAIYTGDLVSVVLGQPAAATATPTTTASANTPTGVCVGVRYTDPVNKQELHSQYLPANAINLGYTNIFVKMVDDPDALFMVQADGSVGLSAIGRNAALNNFGGSTTTGVSTVRVSATVATTATLAVRIVDLVTNGQSAPGDAFTDVIVKFNHGVHAHQNATGQ
jgi:hypothetical protein